jgi:hypothetical protein
VVHHTCTLDQLDANHQNISANFFTSHMHSQIVLNLASEPKSIICAIEEKFRFIISSTRHIGLRRRYWSICGVLM